MLHEKNQVILELPVQVSAAYRFPASNRVRVRFWGFVVAPLAFALGTFVLILTVRVGAALLPAESIDAFAPYQAVMPGQSDAMTEQYPCRRYDVPDVQLTFTCVLLPTDGAFRQVNIFVYEGEIVGMNFRPRNMRVVELVWRWGYPDKIAKLSDKYVIEWNHPISAIIESRPHFSLQAAVSLIRVTKADS